MVSLCSSSMYTGPVYDAGIDGVVEEGDAMVVAARLVSAGRILLLHWTLLLLLLLLLQGTTNPCAGRRARRSRRAGRRMGSRNREGALLL